MKSPRDLRKLAVLILSSSLLSTFIVSTTIVPALGQQSTPAPAIPSSGFAGLDRYRASRIAIFTDDFGQLARYREADAVLKPPAPGENRVVFFGDSITDIWHLDEYFPGKAYLNRGIGGQITGEMLGRMQADVIELKPRLVLVLAGINDLGRGLAVSTIENNLSMIADLAEAHHIEPMFASVLPVSDYHKDVNPQYARTARLAPAKILELNGWLKNFCEQRHFPYVDYYSALVDKAGFLQADLADDGLHPNAKGYRIMAPIALAAIDNVAKLEVKPAKKKGGLREWLQKEHK